MDFQQASRIAALVVFVVGIAVVLFNASLNTTLVLFVGLAFLAFGLIGAIAIGGKSGN